MSLPERALKEVEKLVYVCCMKTHKWAKFTFSLKLAVGFMKPSERVLLHIRRLEEKITDLNLKVHPNLIIMDGRNALLKVDQLQEKYEIQTWFWLQVTE